MAESRDSDSLSDLRQVLNRPRGKLEHTNGEWCWEWITSYFPILKQDNSTLRCLWCQSMAHTGKKPLDLDQSLNTWYILEFYLVDLGKWHHLVHMPWWPTRRTIGWIGWLFYFVVYLGYVCDIGSFLALEQILSLNWVEHAVLLCLAADVLYDCEPG